MKTILSKINLDKKILFGLNDIENSIDESLDEMATQRLILKYKKSESDVLSYAKITKLGLDVIKNIGNIFNPNKK